MNQQKRLKFQAFLWSFTLVWGLVFSTLGARTPADLASIKVEGQNKCITLIQNASKN